MPVAALRVFLSSTAEDLREHRARVVEALDRCDFSAVRMETFGAYPAQPLAICRERIRSCDAFVVIVAHRYGYIPTSDEGGNGQKSITWLEVETALEVHKPIFAYLVREDYPWPGPKEQDGLLQIGATDVGDIFRRVRALQEFSSFLKHRAGLTMATFGSPEDLALKVLVSLVKWERQGALEPKVRQALATQESAEGPTEKASEVEQDQQKPSEYKSEEMRAAITHPDLQLYGIEISTLDGMVFRIKAVSGKFTIRKLVQKFAEQHPTMIRRSSMIVVEVEKDDGNRIQLNSKDTLVEAGLKSGDRLRIYSDTVAGCLPPGTPILGADRHEQPIELIQSGIELLSWNFNLNDFDRAIVISSHRARTTSLIMLNGELFFSPGQSLWANGGWKSANSISFCDELLDAAGNAVPVTTIDVIPMDLDVHHLSTADAKPFFANGILIRPYPSLEDVSELVKTYEAGQPNQDLRDMTLSKLEPIPVSLEKTPAVQEGLPAEPPEDVRLHSAESLAGNAKDQTE